VFATSIKLADPVHPEQAGEIAFKTDLIDFLTADLPVEEICLCADPGVVRFFYLTSDREKFLQALSSHIVRKLNLTPAKISGALTKDGSEAVTQFFRTAIGLDEQGRLSGSVEAFRRWFEGAREAGKIGPILNRLYHRSVWLGEKVRLESNLYKSAVTYESIVVELATKIFGRLDDRTALIAGCDYSPEPFIRRLTDKRIGKLVFHGNGVKPLGMVFSGDYIEAGMLPNYIPKFDLILSFDREFEKHLARPEIRKAFEKRKNAPLLFFSSVDSPASKGLPVDGYNVFKYNLDDLDKILTKNLSEFRAVRQLVEGFIETEVDRFFAWIQEKDQYRFGSIIGKSEAIQKIMELIARISQTDITVLIDGESGTGKELVARAIHEHSRRRERRFIVVNCGAIPESLLESELFGHVKGAFTGASSDQKGLFSAANGGTIFLDEIGETSLAMQVKLLRFLQEGEIKPVGSHETIQLDVRLIAATNRNLDEMVEEGTFRQDLYYRLNVIQITIPPLRERSEDIALLADSFVKKNAEKMHKSVHGIDEDARRLLLDYEWKGNVRELENAMERAVALCAGKLIVAEDLPPTVRLAANERDANGSVSPTLTLKEVEREHILSSLKLHDWNYELVTKLLGIGRTTLWRKMKEYNITSK
jgi:DNA-binding NtrC family response regulator